MVRLVQIMLQQMFGATREVEMSYLLSILTGLLITSCFTGPLYGEDYVIPIVANGAFGGNRLNARLRVFYSSLSLPVQFSGYDDVGGPLNVGCSSSATSRLSVGADGEILYDGYWGHDVCIPFNNPEFGWIKVTPKDAISFQVLNEFQILDWETREALTVTLIPAVIPARKFLIPAIDGEDYLATRNMVGAYAIINPSETETATVEMRAHRPDEPDKPGCVQELTIPPLSRITGHFREFFPICDRGSTIRISGDIPIAVGGLQVFYPEFKMTALPVETIEDSGEE